MAKGKKTGGRQKGAANVLTAELKDMILDSFNKVGGADYLVQIAKTNSSAYVGLLGKVLPKDVNMAGSLKVTSHDDFIEGLKQDE